MDKLRKLTVFKMKSNTNRLFIIIVKSRNLSIRILELALSRKFLQINEN